MDEVVPGWMCLQGLDVQQRAFLGGHFFSSRIESTIKSCVHLESLARSRVGDEIYDDVVTFQWGRLFLRVDDLPPYGADREPY
jgi:hypothetical protein